MSKKNKRLFALSGVLVLLFCIKAPVLITYPLFVLARLRKWKLSRIGSPGLTLLVTTAISTFLLESGAWLDNFLRDDPTPALFHPQLFPDLIIGIGLYTAWWLCWLFMLKRFHFTATQVFIVTGLYGVLIEQQGAVFRMGLATLPQGVLLWLFVFTAYGSAMALAVWLARESFKAKRDKWVKYPLAFGLMFVCSWMVFTAWYLILQALKILPEKRLPMSEFPLW